MLWVTKTLADHPKVNNKLIIDLCNRNILPKDLAVKWYFANSCVRATSFMMWYVSLLETFDKEQNDILMCTKRLISGAIHECLATD